MLSNFEPVKVNGVLYGKTVEFNKKKRYIKFTSKYHNPDFIYYDQIQKITIEDNKRLKKKLLIWSLFTLLIIVGIFLFYVRSHLPPWYMHIELKNPSKKHKTINIEAKIDYLQMKKIKDFCEPDLNISFLKE